MNVRHVTVLLLPVCAFPACGGSAPSVLQSADGKYRLVHVAEAPDAAAARAAMAGALAQLGDIGVVFAHDDASAAAAAATCAEKGRTGVRFVDIGALRLPVADAAIDMALLACNGITTHRELLVGTRVGTNGSAAAGGELVAAPGDFVLDLLRRQHAEVLTTQPSVDVVFRIGLVTTVGGDPWRTRLRDALAVAAKRYPQIAFDCRPTVQEFVAQNYNAILVVGPQPADVAAACKAAVAQNTRVVVVDRKLGSDDFTCFVGIDGDAIGQAAGRETAARLGPAGGAIVEIRGAASQRSDALHQGFVKALGLVQKP